jgi:uncharacterized cupredoxin-like copper-binding protein
VAARLTFNDVQSVAVALRASRISNAAIANANSENPTMRIKSRQTTFSGSIVAAILVLTLSPAAFAAGQHSGGHGPAIGQPGKASEASRTIDIVMTDNRYSIDALSVKKGETIRFRLLNKGNFVHEFNIGTAAMHARHQKEMAMMFEHGVLEVDKIHYDRMKMKRPDGSTMEHDDPNSVLLEPGKSAEIIWKFSTDARLEFACNLPGHYEAGMTGKFNVR